MSEEFKPIRITLSEEAFDQMDKIMKDAKFRSYSSTIEECIRAIHGIIQEMEILMSKENDSTITIPHQEMIDTLLRINMRMVRFTGRAIVRHSKT